MSSASLRHLRHCTALPQDGFADLLGVSVGTIQAVEQGRLPVSENVARRAFLETGAIPASLTANDTEEAAPLAWSGEAYAPRNFANWQRLARNDLLGGTGHLFDLLPAFYDAALSSGKLGKFQASMALAMHDAAEALGITADVRELAVRYGVADLHTASARIAGRAE
jgi:transcriptional regulator with XRE-family HTH domain